MIIVFFDLDALFFKFCPSCHPAFRNVSWNSGSGFALTCSRRSPTGTTMNPDYAGGMPKTSSKYLQLSDIIASIRHLREDSDEPDWRAENQYYSHLINHGRGIIGG